MYLLVLAFTFVNCYCFMITSLYLLSFFTYFIQVPFINEINEIFKIPFSFKLSIDKIIYNKTDDEKTDDEKTDDEKTEDEKTDDEKTEDDKINDPLKEIDDFIQIRKYKFLIDESLD